MNLQTIQKRVEELTSELLTISNDLAFLIQGDVVRQPAIVEVKSDWAADMQAGDLVVCTGFNQYARSAQHRCFTVGKPYVVKNRLTDKTPDHQFYGIRVERDDENDGHCAVGVKFAKVIA
jgi:hypothetical protein